MIHGDTSHAPRSFDIQESPPVVITEQDIEDIVVELRKKRNALEFQWRSRGIKPKTLERLKQKIDEINIRIESMGVPTRGKRGKRRKI